MVPTGMPAPGLYTFPVHFEDFDGAQFERLVFAYFLRAERWRQLEWYGQVGSDLGRDIWGIRDAGSPSGETVCIQCVNRARLTFAKARNDIDKVVAAPGGVPDTFVLVCRGNAGANLRDQIRQYAGRRGIHRVEVWSGQEFEERLHRDAEPLLQRFVRGEAFPDTPSELQSFVSRAKDGGDQELVANIARLLDRPAFHTPFRREGSIPDFKKAITDTIEALNTGVHRLRDGTEIGRFPPRHAVRDQSVRDALRTIERRLCHLRATYDDLMRRGELRRCACGKPECDIYFISDRAAISMDSLRRAILEEFRRIYPQFAVFLGLPEFQIP